MCICACLCAHECVHVIVCLDPRTWLCAGETTGRWVLGSKRRRFAHGRALSPENTGPCRIQEARIRSIPRTEPEGAWRIHGYGHASQNCGRTCFTKKCSDEHKHEPENTHTHTHTFVYTVTHPCKHTHTSKHTVTTHSDPQGSGEEFWDKQFSVRVEWKVMDVKAGKHTPLHVHTIVATNRRGESCHSWCGCCCCCCSISCRIS